MQRYELIRIFAAIKAERKVGTSRNNMENSERKVGTSKNYMKNSERKVGTSKNNMKSSERKGGTIEYLYPGIPNHPKQKYKATNKNSNK